MNNIQRKFNNWVGKNFKGLSAHTLCQFIEMKMMLPIDYINNMVYVDLFHVFIGKSTENEINTYDTTKMLVNNCEWI